MSDSSKRIASDDGPVTLSELRDAIKGTEYWEAAVKAIATEVDQGFWGDFRRPPDRDAARAALDRAWGKGLIKSWRDVVVMYLALETIGSGARSAGMTDAGVRMYDAAAE